MRQVSLPDGFTIEVNDRELQNMETIDILSELEAGEGTSALLYPRLLNRLFGKDGKKAIYDRVRSDDGIVEIEKVAELTNEIIIELGKKKS